LLVTFHDKYGNQIDSVLMWREKNYVEKKNSKK